MGRLPAFAEHRFVGIREDMTIFDCDNDDQFEQLADRVERDGLVSAGGLQSFGPDTEAEAKNRGFRLP